MKQTVSTAFEPLLTCTQKAAADFGASAASVVIIQDHQIAAEWYAGHHHFKSGALPVSADSMFNLYSTRKTYVGLATAIAVVEGGIPIDTKVSELVTDMTESELDGVTIRHLATKSHHKYYGANRIEREELASKIIRNITGSNINELITARIFKPLGLTHTEWASVPHERLVCDYQAADGYASVRIESDEGHERNLYASARDLAFWGNLHLHQGRIGQEQLVPAEAFELAAQLRMDTEDENRIFGWYHMKHWYYATGEAGCHCVVVPEFNAVAVRMLNRYTDNYAEDQRYFNETFYPCLQR